MELFKALTEISSLFARSRTEEELLTHLVDRTCYETGSELAVVFIRNDNRQFTSHVSSHRDPKEYSFRGNGDFIEFLDECGEAVVSHRGADGPFPGLLIRKDMGSAAAYPLRRRGEFRFLLILNAEKNLYYNDDKLLFLESACRIVEEALNRMGERE